MAHTSSAAEPYSLDDCFLLALKQSELIATQSELVSQSEEQYKEARAALFPLITGSASYLVQQAPSSITASNNSPAEQTTAKLTAAQPLFRGLREYALLSQRNLQITARISTRRQVASQLYSDVSTNYYMILSFEQTLRDYQSELDVYRERISELNKRIQIGRSKVSEVLTVKAAVDNLAAQAEITRSQLATAREVFAFLTGLNQNSRLTESLPSEPKVLSLDSYLERINERPDVKSARDELAATDKSVAIARGGHFPSMDLVGDYFFKRPGIAADQHWAVQVQATVPIFAGGLINAQVREAASAGRQSELALARARRNADQEIRANFSNVHSDLSQVSRLKQAEQSALENYRAQSRDYKLGLVSNLDVLQSITASQQAKRALDAVRFQQKLDLIRLEIAAALRPLKNGGDFIYE